MRKPPLPDLTKDSPVQLSIPSLLMESMLYENALTDHGHSTTYENFLLSPIMPPEHAWWRCHQALPPATIPTNTAVKLLHDALMQAANPQSAEDIPGSTLELQKIARLALRIGSWKLLQPVLRILLDQLRSQLPTSRRMSQATGLIAEWALASLQPQIALIYSQESLAWGAEPHRIRSYVAYAHACLKTGSVRDDMDMLLSMQAAERQALLSDRIVFGKLHQIRLACLTPSDGTSRFFSTSIENLTAMVQNFLRDSNPDHPATHLAACAAAASEIDLGEFTFAVQSGINFLIRSGRWRDRLLLNQIDPSRFASLSLHEEKLVSSLNEIAAALPDDPSVTPDSLYLPILPSSALQASPQEALTAFLCCI